MHDAPKNFAAYHKALHESLENAFLRKALDKFAVDYRASRANIFKDVPERELISRIAEAKDRSCKRLDELYRQFKQEAEKRGAKVHFAKTAAEANEIIARIAQENNVKKIIKSKSMTAEETLLNHRLEQDGLEITETDLGEWIIQLRHEPPSHMVMPAIHLSRDEVAEDFPAPRRNGTATTSASWSRWPAANCAASSSKPTWAYPARTSRLPKPATSPSSPTRATAAL